MLPVLPALRIRTTRQPPLSRQVRPRQDWPPSWSALPAEERGAPRQKLGGWCWTTQMRPGWSLVPSWLLPRDYVRSRTSTWSVLARLIDLDHRALDSPQLG